MGSQKGLILLCIPMLNISSSLGSSSVIHDLFTNSSGVGPSVMAYSQEMQPPVFNIAIFRLQKFVIVSWHHVHEHTAVKTATFSL